MALLRLVCVLLGLCAATAASAAEQVSVRVGEHPGLSRLIFGWSELPEVELERQPGQAILQFDRPGELDLTRFNAQPPLDVLGITSEAGEGGVRVTVAIGADAALRLSRRGNDVVLDVVRSAAPTDVPPANLEEWRRRQMAGQDREAKAPTPTSTPAPAPVPARKPDERPAPQVAKAAQADSAAPVGRPISILPTRKPDRPPKSAEPAPEAPAKVTATDVAKVDPKTEAKAEPKAEAETEPEVEAEAEPKIETTAETAIETTAETATMAEVERPYAVKRSYAPAPTEVSLPADGAAGDMVSRADGSSLSDWTRMTAPPSPRAAPGALRFDWQADVAAAAFRAGTHFWLVFDRPAPGDLTDLITTLAPEVAPVVQFEAAGATYIRLSAPPVMEPRLWRDGTAWVLDLWPFQSRADGQITAEVLRDQVVFQVQRPGRALPLTEPALGGELIVVPTPAAGHGHPIARAFPQFRVLPSVQGLVLQRLADDAKLRVEADTVTVHGPGGLFLSYGGTLAILKSNLRAPEHGPRLLDLAAWRRGESLEFAGSRRDLQAKLVETAPDRLGIVRLDLARFYFAHGLAPEALGLLRLGERLDPRLGEDPEVRLLKGASAFLIGEFDAAAEELFHPAVAGEWEAALWHGALAAVSHDWGAATARFADTEPLIATYPQSVRTRLRLLAADAWLAIGETETADRLLDQIEADDPSRAEEAQIAFFLGRRLHLEGNADGAKTLWVRVAAQTYHRPSQIRARLSLLDLGLESGDMSDDEAIAELERLRFAWRGDRLERALLLRLGDLYGARGEYRRALNALRQAAAHFPGRGGASAVAQRMRSLFVDVHLDRVERELDAAGAVALYDEFKELTPPGSEGDAVINRLAERLVEIDLLARAAELLGAQVKYRLSGEARAEAGARLARIHLLDDAPAAAIEALEASAGSDLPEDLVRARRHLRARALDGLGRGEEVLTLLAEDDAPEALRLRAGVFWERRDWDAAALVLRRLVAERPPENLALGEAESQDVIHLAVALTMAGDRAGLAALAEAYGPAMDAGAHRDTFALLADSRMSDGAMSIAEELAEVGLVEAFMNSYRERLQNAGLGEAN